jgi:hypothetical protein
MVRSSFLESKREFPNALPSHVLENPLNPQNIHVNAAHKSHCLAAEEYNSISILSACKVTCYSLPFFQRRQKGAQNQQLLLNLGRKKSAWHMTRFLFQSRSGTNSLQE